MANKHPFASHLTILLLLITVFAGLAGCSGTDEKPEYVPKIKDHSDLWDRVRSSFELQYAYGNPGVRKRISWFRSHQGHLNRLSERGERYLHHIVSETERRGIPGEVALLPAVESAFQPFAYSPAHASGIWQFIPATGQRFGLEQNWWYDGRRDITAATDAALDYLEQLNRRFDGDWLLAIAAYNTGEGNVERAIERNRKQGKPTDFWSLGLHSETRNYVPQLLALATVVEKPRAYGLRLDKIPNRPYFEQVATHGPIELSLAAKLVGLSTEELRALNPGHKRWATAPSGPHHLLVPKGKAKVFEKKLAAIPRSKRVRWHRHVVKKGESMHTIANWFKVPISVLQQANRQRGNVILPGQGIMVPVAYRANYQPDTGMLARKAASKKKHQIHVVRSGENLSIIARKYDVSLAKLLAWNDITRNGKLMPGQRLKLYRQKLYR